MWALVELARRAREDPNLELRLELLDDIEFGHGGAPSELLQVKHSVKNTSLLDAKDVQIWRTLNVWMDLPTDLAVVLRLVTTASADGSELQCLRDGASRDLDCALEVLLDGAKSSTNKTTAPWREKYVNLGEDGQRQLLEQVYLDDASPPAADLRTELISEFRWAIRRGQEDAFIDHLLGWWAGVAVRLLDRSLSAVTSGDLQAQVSDLVDQFKSDSLPVDPLVLVTFAKEESESYYGRVFVEQLLWIALDETRLWKAIRDYHRASTQRSSWLRYNLVSETELQAYAFDLYDQWENFFDEAVARMNRDRRADREMVGQEIMQQLSRECRARVRERFDSPWFNRGMMHSLADGEVALQIGWHPDFQEKLSKLLADAVT